MQQSRQLHDRWEASLFAFLMTDLDLGFTLVESAAVRHGLKRVEKLQKARLIHDSVRVMCSKGVLAASHQTQIRVRLGLLGETLSARGAKSLQSVPSLADTWPHTPGADRE